MKHEKPVTKSSPKKLPAKKAARKAAKGARAPGLVIRPSKNGPLGKTQLQFNKLMKSLEKTRERHALEQARLDDALQVSSRELMPLVEGVKRLNRDLVIQGMEAMQKMKLTARRRESFSDLLHGKASDLLMDPVGLSDEDIEKLKAIADELGPDEEEKRLMDEEDADEFDYLREMIEAQARAAGIEVDLSGLDIHSGPEEFERQIRERLEEAVEQAGDPQSAKPKKPRKLTQAQAERERKRLELEQARNRDLKRKFPPKWRGRMRRFPLFYAGWTTFWEFLFSGYICRTLG
jgi:hypothetical protein